MEIKMTSPLGKQSPITVQRVNLKAALIYEDLILGNFQAWGLPGILIICKSQFLVALKLSSDVIEVHMNLSLDLFQYGNNFARFVKNFFEQASIKLLMRGTIDIAASTVVSDVALDGLALNSTMKLNGNLLLYISLKFNFRVEWDEKCTNYSNGLSSKQSFWFFQKLLTFLNIIGGVFVTFNTTLLNPTVTRSNLNFVYPIV